MLRSLDTYKSYRPNIKFIYYDRHVVSLDTSQFIEITVVFTEELGDLRTTALISVKGEKIIISEAELRETPFIAKNCLSNKPMELLEPLALLKCNIL